MTGSFDVDRVLDDWLGEGPSRMPEQLVSTTLDQIDHIPQRRPWLPWSPTMNRLVTYGVGLAAVLVVAIAAWSALGGSWGVGGQPTPSPTPIPTETFTSASHGYTVRLPLAGWTFEPRAGTWALGEYFDANSGSGVDYYERPLTAQSPALFVYIASQPVPDGMTFDGWAATHDAANRAEVPCFLPVAGGAEPATVDGEPARVIAQRCEFFDGDRAWMAVQTLFIHAGRGYALYVWPQVQGDLMPHVDELKAESAAWLAGFTFTE